MNAILKIAGGFVGLILIAITLRVFSAELDALSAPIPIPVAAR